MVCAQMEYVDPASSRVELPFGDLMMATAAFSSNHFINRNSHSETLAEFENILGFPDLIANDNTFFHLKKRSSVILTFGDYLIRDLKKKDIYLFGEGDFSNIKVSISADGRKWEHVGSVDPKSHSINLKKSKYPKNYYKYLRLRNYSKQPKSEEETLIDAVAIVARSNDVKRYFPLEVDTLSLSNNEPMLRLKDSKLIDGDAVEVKINQKEERKVLIGRTYTNIKFGELRAGTHRVIVKALNRGLIPPNTFKLEIVDGDKVFYKTYRINKDKKVTLYIEK